MELDDWSDDDDTDDVQPSKSPKSKQGSAGDRRVRMLEQKLAQAKQDLADYRKLVEARFDLSRLAEQLTEPPSGSPAVGDQTPRDDDSHYFRSYGENGAPSAKAYQLLDP